ncbi:N-acetylglucosamine kinase [Thermoplasma sp. Kam2015]|uniref:N-acetylglucosamine kinase n=1 Tax=Thermoplasma sp. Kam2015 TaxID=2094122 RepID=UPI000D8FBB96|nr:N-acetylglucosamine kinase [Thermoplasma sp. Kam2015]PYB69099.1 N-acetylglucosamine kinase [Thermoplasma sp. Kam2015]
MEEEMMILGVDGGSTKTLAIVFDERSESIAGVGISGPSNFTNAPRETATANISDAVKKACSEAGVDMRSIDTKVFGLAGIGDSKEATELGKDIVRSIVGKADVVSDGLGAYKFANLNEDGVVFAPGTGSVGFLKKGGEPKRFGGWGWVIGDEGSASWMAKQAILLAEREYDGISETGFRDIVMSYFGMDLYEVVYAISKERIAKRVVAALAPHISAMARSGNKYANSIFEESSSYISEVMNSKSKALGGSGRYSVLGGTMLAGDFYQHMIRSKTSVPVNIYYGYQVAIGDVLMGLEKKGEIDLSIRDKIIRQLNASLKNKPEDIKEFLFMENVPES